jgi:hypothetical protein
MPEFDAGKVVEPMTFKFEDFGGENGTIPEPSDRQLGQMYRSLKDLSDKVIRQKSDLPEDATPVQIFEAMALLSPGDVFEDMLNGSTEIYATVCSNKPSKAQLKKLPPRIRIIFFQWLTEQLRPEAKGVGSPSQVTDIRTARGA